REEHETPVAPPDAERLAVVMALLIGGGDEEDMDIGGRESQPDSARSSAEDLAGFLIGSAEARRRSPEVGEGGAGGEAVWAESVFAAVDHVFRSGLPALGGEMALNGQ